MDRVVTKEHLMQYLLEYRNLPGFLKLQEEYQYPDIGGLFAEAKERARQGKNEIQYSGNPFIRSRSNPALPRGYSTLLEWLEKVEYMWTKQEEVKCH